MRCLSQIHLNSNNSPFRFNAKELDCLSREAVRFGKETGNYYYGARYGVYPEHSRRDPKWSIWLSVDPLAEMYPATSSYAYVANNPINAIDPDGRIIIPIHGTWSKISTWENPSGISLATMNLFGDGNLGDSYPWSGGNYAPMRTLAATDLIDHVRGQLENSKEGEPITLVGHSHGGNVAIEAFNMMAEMEEFDGIEFNLLTINTPVRDDYQLTENAQKRVNHVNVFDPKDPVQSKGGNDFTIFPSTLTATKGTGEYGKAGRKFDTARKNIKVQNPQSLIIWDVLKNQVEKGDIHNSHNRVDDWILQTEQQ